MEKLKAPRPLSGSVLPEALPLLEQMDVANLIDRHLPPDPQLEYSHGQVLSLLLAAPLASPTALVNVPAWAEKAGADILWNIPAAKLNDDRLGRALDAMAPQLDATYRRIERQIGEEFSERFQQALAQLLATLQAHEPGRRPARADRDSGDIDEASLRGDTRGALQQELLEVERP